ncbi:hypothetical protein R1sor_027265 [Riccia sorocarpa]|uniref:Uncharacterized protein n=1 Tax=Riccia sorocarpa TaxID=122646 RepID=A0ABD3GGK9_9MARC
MGDRGGFFSGGIFHLPHHQEHPQGHVEPPPYPPTNMLPKGEIVKVFCQARPDYNLAVRNHEIVLVPGNDSDPYQTWIKDESWNTRIKDSAGFPSFALVNRGTGKALRHATSSESPVLLEEYEPNVLNEVILWTMSADVSEGFRAIRPVNNIHLNLDADHGSEKYGGVQDGTKVILFKWKHEPNQHWMLGPVEVRDTVHSSFMPQHEQQYDHHQDPRLTPDIRNDQQRFPPPGQYDHHQDPRLPPQVRFDQHQVSAFPPPQGQYDHHQDPRLPPQVRLDQHQDPRFPPQGQYDHHQDPRLPPHVRLDQHQDTRFPNEGQYDHHQDPRLPPQVRLDQHQYPYGPGYERR